MTLPNDLRGKAVLITGGTMGIGLATALAFGRQQAHTILTYKWGSADESEVRDHFRRIGAPDPLIVRADVVDEEDTAALMQELRGRHDAIEVFVSNVAFGLLINSLDDYKKRSFFKTVEYSTWPLVDYVQRIRQTFGRYPRYVVGISSDGPETYLNHYDFVAASKAALETLCRYMAQRLAPDGVSVNVVRSRFADTQSLTDTFGRDFVEFAHQVGGPDVPLPLEDVANAILALCSGLLDGVRGQTLMVDRGSGFTDNIMRVFNARQALGLSSTDARTEFEFGGDSGA
ncbi:MAG: SDR family oxidoreductase [Chloroflexi bacterium]|nr:SDR family oxidoreductase [Chloroflexota bacterium]